MTSDDVLAFWFGDDPTLFRRERWFKAGADLDAEIREKFSFTLEAAMDGALDPWAHTPLGTLALVIVLDQFPRHIYRGTMRAYAGDAHARRVARSAVAGRVDAHLTPVQRIFLYLPFEHSEELADQEQSLILFAGLRGGDWEDRTLDSARKHHDIIARFGRFPHRNADLDRTSTAEEAAFLAAHGRGF